MKIHNILNTVNSSYILLSPRIKLKAQMSISSGEFCTRLPPLLTVASLSK